jgi:hypothetical protein
LRKILREFVVVNNQVGDVDVAVILLNKHILAYLISSSMSAIDISRIMLASLPVDEDVVESELHDEVNQRLLDARGCSRILRSIGCLAAEEADRVC